MDITVWIFTIQLVGLLTYFKWIFLDLDFDLVLKMAPARTSGAFFGKPKGGRGSWTPANGPYLGQAWVFEIQKTHMQQKQHFETISYIIGIGVNIIYWWIVYMEIPVFLWWKSSEFPIFGSIKLSQLANPQPRPRQLPKLPGWWVKVLKLRITLGSGRGCDFCWVMWVDAMFHLVQSG